MNRTACWSPLLCASANTAGPQSGMRSPSLVDMEEMRDPTRIPWVGYGRAPSGTVFPRGGKLVSILYLKNSRERCNASLGGEAVHDYACIVSLTSSDI
jgi:hypothetical protein